MRAGGSGSSRHLLRTSVRADDWKGVVISGTPPHQPFSPAVTPCPSRARRLSSAVWCISLLFFSLSCFNLCASPPAPRRGPRCAPPRPPPRRRCGEPALRACAARLRCVPALHACAAGGCRGQRGCEGPSGALLGCRCCFAPVPSACASHVPGPLPCAAL